jgi:hypothetical protein
MRVEITYDNEVYHWKLYDGPDGIDFFSGIELDFGQCFQRIIEKRIINSLTYANTDESLKETIGMYLRCVGI